MRFLLRLVLLAFLPVLAACTKPAVWAPEGDVLAARYTHPGPPSIALFNVINNDTNNGEHAALMINADQRVLFDPAGSWRHPLSPERHDVHFGFDNAQLFRYTYYHARRTHRVQIQHLEVSPQVAAMILALAQQAGPVPDAHCARSIGQILQQVPGFETIPVAFRPNRLSDAFGQLPGVRTEIVTSDAEPTERQAYLE